MGAHPGLWPSRQFYYILCIGKCTRELTGTCDRRVRPQCLGCASAQSAEVHR